MCTARSIPGLGLSHSPGWREMALRSVLPRSPRQTNVINGSSPVSPGPSRLPSPYGLVTLESDCWYVGAALPCALVRLGMSGPSGSVIVLLSAPGPCGRPPSGAFGVGICRDLLCTASPHPPPRQLGFAAPDRACEL